MRTYEVIKKINVSLPITVLDAKKQLNLEADFVEDDDLITRFIRSAERYCSGIIGCDISVTTVTHKISNFLGGTIRVKENPLKSMTSVTHISSDGITTVISADDYKLYESQYFFDITLPVEYGGDGETIIMVYDTGVVNSEIPEDILNAIHVKVATLYDHEREDYSDYKLKSNRAISGLLSPYIRML